jgi:hypothetical protein
VLQNVEQRWQSTRFHVYQKLSQHLT